MNNAKGTVLNLLKKKKIQALLFFIGALSLYLFRIGHESLWYDEMLVYHFSGRNFIDMLSGIGFTGSEAHPPLFHMLIWLFRFISENPLFLRSVSAVTGAALVLTVFHFTGKHLKKKTSVTITFLVMLNPIILTFSQELRMYILSTLLLPCTCSFCLKFPAGTVYRYGSY
jgi:uncharacterized membrane protein